MHDLLAAIVACARTTVEARRRRTPIDEVARQAASMNPRGAEFRARLARPRSTNVIAECKRRSPARGVLAQEYRPDEIARRYEAGGAAAISMLTEPCFFDGSLAHLASVRRAVEVPLLRKDFVVDEYQLFEAAAAGADAALLIVAALEPADLRRLVERAQALGLAALVEVHAPDELDRALDAGATIIGVNSRDLRTLAVNRAVFAPMAARIPARCIAVAESGLSSEPDVRRLQDAGYRAFLIGEWLMTRPDAAGVLRELTGAGVA
jgi:indole-3-glycerol phosphate synthase